LEVVVVGFGSGCDSFWKWLLLVLEVVVANENRLLIDSEIGCW
jgi:hypothetical protein